MAAAAGGLRLLVQLRRGWRPAVAGVQAAAAVVQWQPWQRGQRCREVSSSPLPAWPARTGWWRAAAAGHPPAPPCGAYIHGHRRQAAATAALASSCNPCFRWRQLAQESRTLSAQGVLHLCACWRAGGTTTDRVPCVPCSCQLTGCPGVKAAHWLPGSERGPPLCAKHQRLEGGHL